MFLRNLEEKLILQTQQRIKKGLKDLPSPLLLKNNTIAAKRIVSLLMEGKKMLIVGDYDTDGILATTIMYGFLAEAGFSEQVDYLIPSRLKDGYGLSENVIVHAIEEKYDFIVTVDNGISAIAAIDLANKNNLKVIITDHHTAGKELPKADIIVNPRVEGETLPYTHISGATVAWYVIAEIKRELNSNININKYLDLVAITILADVMPLDDINLPILQYGMTLIKSRSRLIYKLIWNDWTAPTIDETAVSFNMVPMINAIGRIANANIGVKMFLSEDEYEIKNLVDDMKEINERRKELTRLYIDEADKYIEEFIDVSNKKVIIVRNSNFHEGIIGIIAGRIAEKYQLPAYVFAYNEEKNIWKGSARSTGNVHLYNLTSKVDYLLAGFGGHKGAVGLAVTSENWDKMNEELSLEADKIDPHVFTENGKLVINCSLDEINQDLISLMKKYGPYGYGNLKPIFRTVVSVHVDKELKGGLHFKCICKQNDSSMVGLFFNVKKVEFLDIINNKLIIDFDPSISYDLKNDLFKIEIIVSSFKQAI